MQITLDKNKLTDFPGGKYRRFPVSLTPLGHHGGRLPSGNRRLGADRPPQTSASPLRDPRVALSLDTDESWGSLPQSWGVSLGTNGTPVPGVVAHIAPWRGPGGRRDGGVDP
jgi:hypothetical protein